MNGAETVTGAFSGGSGAGTQTLTVSVTGSGKVTGPGIDCGNGATDCSEPYATGTSVTLTESPSTEATFTGWGGSCSGSATVCTVVTSASTSLTATFGPGSSQRILTVRVGGAGRVTGRGVSCGAGARDCSHAFNRGAVILLTATPSAGAVFLGWRGTCRGTARTCTVSMTAPKAVSASFSTPGARRGGTFAARSLGSPIVTRTTAGWAVRLRFYTSRSAVALLHLSHSGRFVQAFTFSPHTGNILVGPFHVGRPGGYRFRMTLSDGRGNTAELIWNIGLGGRPGPRAGDLP
jgi:hypothetical protein